MKGIQPPPVPVSRECKAVDYCQKRTSQRFTACSKLVGHRSKEGLRPAKSNLKSVPIMTMNLKELHRVGYRLHTGRYTSPRNFGKGRCSCFEEVLEDTACSLNILSTHAVIFPLPSSLYTSKLLLELSIPLHSQRGTHNLHSTTQSEVREVLFVACRRDAEGC